MMLAVEEMAALPAAADECLAGVEGGEVPGSAIGWQQQQQQQARGAVTGDI
jgi:hypothetical protein